MDIPQCPYVIVSDAVGAYSMGFLISYPFHYWINRNKFRESPVRSLKLRRWLLRPCAKTGFAFFRWGFFYTSWVCMLSYLLKRNDAVTSIIAGGMVTGTMAPKRRNKRSFFKHFRTGALFMTAIEVFMWFTELGDFGPMELIEPIPGLQEYQIKQIQAEANKA
eukprot:TRINITY_DN874_c0_g2_i1.p1 TRINITY_DN874_c0_g2~~TRINITY_DN874_c0_g2_i1.p1  ORF type:complete len:163 (+),score=7.70 TRINITY_DN874_c0_g2_i1:35-523(+)